MKKPKIKTLRLKCDKLLSKVIRDRDGCCVRCGSSDRLEAHHFIRREVLSTRYDLDNLLTLCSSCHRLIHKFPIKENELFYEKLGKEKYWALSDRGHTKLSTVLDRITWYQERYNQLKGEE